jgi:hypothetical protein
VVWAIGSEDYSRVSQTPSELTAIGAPTRSLVDVARSWSAIVLYEGPGIPADVLEMIFTPFFTTKARGDRVWGCQPSGASSKRTTARSAWRVHPLVERS